MVITNCASSSSAIVVRSLTTLRAVIVLLAGSCQLLGDGPTLAAPDSVVLPGGLEYGFTAGPEGMTFLTIRTGKSGTRLA